MLRDRRDHINYYLFPFQLDCEQWSWVFRDWECLPVDFCCLATFLGNWLRAIDVGCGTYNKRSYQCGSIEVSSGTLSAP